MALGYVLVESMRPGSRLDGLPLTLTKIERYPVRDPTPEQPSVWTTVEFEFPEEEAGRLADALAEVLEEKGGWYSHFNVSRETFVAAVPTRRQDGSGSGSPSFGATADAARSADAAAPAPPPPSTTSSRAQHTHTCSSTPRTCRQRASPATTGTAPSSAPTTAPTASSSPTSSRWWKSRRPRSSSFAASSSDGTSVTRYRESPEPGSA
jgi:hypothetical protein